MGLTAATRRALMVVDLQQGPLRDAPQLRDLPDRIGDHLSRARDAYALVVATAFRNEPGSTYERLVGDDLRDDEEVAIVPAIAGAADLTDESCTYSSLTPAVRAALEDAGVREVHVAGIDTDQCVLATVFALFDAGYEPRVLEDLVGSASGAEPHRSGLVALRRAIGEDRVAPAAEVEAVVARTDTNL